MMNYTKLLCFIALVFPMFLGAQAIDQKEAGLRFLTENYEQFGLTKADIENVVVTDMYTTKHNGMTHIYFAQTYKDVPVHNALFNVTVKADNDILHHGNRFVYDLQSKITADEMQISASKAVRYVATDLGVKLTERPTALRKESNGKVVFKIDNLARNEITAQAQYYKVNEIDYRLSWEVILVQKGTPDSWMMHIDAATGEVIGKENLTLKCKITPGQYHHHNNGCYGHDDLTISVPQAPATMLGDGSSYDVFALPVESPVHGARSTAVDPSLEIASPYGWHDLDGQPGPEYTITRGNNCHAFEDSAQLDVSTGNEPEGGESLTFNYPYDENLNAFDNMEADVTNTFYAVNAVHDIMYLLGFDEAAGNFQNNNYGKGGAGNDDISAHTLDGAAAGNAFWIGGGGVDGTQPTTELGIWENSAGLFRVLSPSDVQASYESNYASTDWSALPPIDEVDIEAEMVLVADSNPQSPNQGCGELVTDVEGKIAVIYRGICQFGTKALNAENAGAVAAIICNVPGADAPGSDGENAMGMAPGNDGNSVTIPLLSLAYGDCNRIVAAMDDAPVIGQMKIPEITGPTELSTGLDNGVIAHEIGHGVSQRLIGGPSNGACVNNGENLGDGIADFMTLIMTVKEGDKGEDPRGIGAYVIGQPGTGRGIRGFPYSTDFNINPHVYDNIIGETDPHPIGEVLVATLWDMYWAYVDLYGYDADWTNTESGNFRASQIVVDAFKLCPCDPGFLDIRDALFAADGFQHECMLWDIFARRGLGFFADQGSTEDPDDGTQDFEPKPTCIQTLKIKRTVAELIEAGDQMTINFDIANHTTETATNVTIVDELQEGLTIESVPAGVEYEQSGNTVTFTIGDMATLEERSFSYVVNTDPTYTSLSQYYNSAENFTSQGEWDRDFVEGNNFWSLSSFDAKSGIQSWFVQELDEVTDQRLIVKDFTVTGDRPTFRAWHRPNCTISTNGGFLEISTDGGNIWNIVQEDQFIRGGYRGNLSYRTFAIPNLRGYSGYTEIGDFRDLYLDLSDYIGETVKIQFRFGTDDEDQMPNSAFFGDNDGWYVDDAEFMDLRSYITQATINADNADPISTGPQETIVESDAPSNNNDLEDIGVNISLFPNPASKAVTVAINADHNMDADISILSMEGRVLASKAAPIYQKENFIQLDLAQYTPGFYYVQVRSGDRLTTKKLVIE